MKKDTVLRIGWGACTFEKSKVERPQRERPGHQAFLPPMSSENSLFIGFMFFSFTLSLSFCSFPRFPPGFSGLFCFFVRRCSHTNDKFDIQQKHLTKKQLKQTTKQQNQPEPMPWMCFPSFFSKRPVVHGMWTS